MATKTNNVKKNAKKSVVIKKMRATLGNVTASCEAADIARTTYYDWYEKDADFRAAIDAISESCIDFAESSLMQQIKDGNPTSTIFYLKTKGKKRGYVEKVESEVTIKKDKYDAMSAAELQAEARRMLESMKD